MRKSLLSFLIVVALTIGIIAYADEAPDVFFLDPSVPFGSTISDLKFTYGDIKFTAIPNVYEMIVPYFGFDTAYFIFDDSGKLIAIGSKNIQDGIQDMYTDAKQELVRTYGAPLKTDQADIVSLVNPTEFMKRGIGCTPSTFDGEDCISWETDSAQVVLYKDIDGMPEFNDPAVYVLYTVKDISKYFTN